MTVNGATDLSKPYQYLVDDLSRPCQPIPVPYEFPIEPGTQPFALYGKK